MKNSKALLIIDMQKGSFTSATPRFDTDGVVSRINELAATFRSLDFPVIYIQHDGTGTGEFEKYSTEWEILDDLIVKPTDTLIDKYAAAVERGDDEAIQETRKTIDKALLNLRIDDRPIGGEVSRVINGAKTYRTQIVEQVATEAESFVQLLPQYQRNPRLVKTKLWEDAREQILTGDVETFYTVPGQLELQLNRDPELQKERQKEQLRTRRKAQEAAEANR